MIDNSNFMNNTKFMSEVYDEVEACEGYGKEFLIHIIDNIIDSFPDEIDIDPETIFNYLLKDFIKYDLEKDVYWCIYHDEEIEW